jgi:hypothetical protein
MAMPNRFPINKALNEILNRKVPNDPHGRKFADLIAEAMVRRAEGNVQAVRTITDWVEGVVSQQRELKRPRKAIPTEIKVIWPPERAETA